MLYFTPSSRGALLVEILPEYSVSFDKISCSRPRTLRTQHKRRKYSSSYHPFHFHHTYRCEACIAVRAGITTTEGALSGTCSSADDDDWVEPSTMLGEEEFKSVD